jgi:hypothetical protein
MSRKRPERPDELLSRQLAARPPGTRCALALDPDRLVDFGRTLLDETGRIWEIVPYRGDDVATRQTWERARSGDEPILLVLTRPEGDDGPLDASGIADLISRGEGSPVDLSIVGYFHSLFPRVNPPVSALFEHRHAFVERVDEIVKAYPRWKDRWGEPDNWSRGQFLAILLMARFPNWSLDDLWCDEESPWSFAAHALGLLCHPDVCPADLPAVAEVIWESARHARTSDQVAWLSVPATDLEAFREEIAAFFVLRDLASLPARPHLDTLMRVKLPLTTFDPEPVGEVLPGITVPIKDSGRWTDLRRRAEPFLTLARLSKIADLLPSGSEAPARVLESESAPRAVCAFMIRQALLDRFHAKAEGWPSWARKLDRHPIVERFRRGELTDPSERGCAALREATAILSWVEEALAQDVPDFASAEALLDWYVAQSRHLLEFRVAQAFALLESIDDSAVHEAAHKFVMVPPQGLRHRVRHYTDQLDRRLAEFIRGDAHAFQYGKRSALRIIPDLLRTGRRMVGKRVWILVMDGMRYDTWDAVIRPLLTEHFQVVSGLDRAYFSLLPSKTDIARRGLLAAAIGKDWKNYSGFPTKDERVLAARAVGVPKHEFDVKVRFVAEAETTDARAKMGYSPDELRDVNVLIYPISDDLGHYHNDTLASLNEKIRSQLVSQQGMRGIIDDLRSRVQPTDLVLITSDHGFQELFPEDGVTISAAKLYKQGKSEEDVAYRYLRFEVPADWGVGEFVVAPWEEQVSGKKQITHFTLPVGASWYQREKGKPARFAHGGVSLAEMVIPGVLMQPIQKKAARVELLGLPTEFAVKEDEEQTLTFEIINQGNVAAAYHLSVRSNLGQAMLDRKGELPPGKREAFSCKVFGQYQADLNREPIREKTLTVLNVKLGHGSLDGKMVWPNYGRETVRVTVRPKPTKIDTDALKAFDEL